MIHELLKKNEKECLGCAACFNICPADSITMEPDEEGFFKPVINEDTCVRCGACERVCPQLDRTPSENKADPKCFALHADDEVMKVSSSGGVFTTLANYVFAKGGYVCGAAFDDDFMGVSHIMISSPEEMYKVRGSKYVQSKPGTIYKQVKEKLKDGSTVLFSGTPCQVTALLSYLGKPHKNLITVDFPCGGTPSENVFRMYQEEFRNGRTPVAINFRAKEYASWGMGAIETKFSDGTKNVAKANKDPYMNGFLRNVFKNKACIKCGYAEVPRYADFTMGDFWNIDKYVTDREFENGCSCMLLNNEKAEKIFEEIKAQYTYLRPMPISLLRRFNRLANGVRPSPARDRFFSLIKKGMPFRKAVDYAMNSKFDVALSGCWTVKNYGGVLTYYALYNIMKSMGKEVTMVECRRINSEPATPVPVAFRVNPYPAYDICRIHTSLEDQREINLRVPNYVIGADQVWNPRLFNEIALKSYNFDYTSDWRKRIAYATSFGTEAFRGTPEQEKTFKNHISRFDYISVREKSGTRILDEMGIHGSEWMLDPVLLATPEMFEPLFENTTDCVHNNYMFSYLTTPDVHKYGIDKFAKKFNLPHICSMNYGRERIDPFLAKWPYPYVENLKVEDWLSYLKNCDYLLTDSFHACCFAILYKKNFVFIKGGMSDDYGFNRMTTLLGHFGMMDRVALTVEEAMNNPHFMEPIDYEPVYEILEKERKRCYTWLKNALDADKIV